MMMNTNSNSEDNIAEEENAIHAIDYLYVIFRHFKAVLFVFLLVFSVGAFISYHLPGEYTAVCDIQIIREDKVMQVEAFDIKYKGSKNWLATEFELLSSNPILEKIVKKNNLTEYFENMEQHSLGRNLGNTFGFDLAAVKRKIRSALGAKDIIPAKPEVTVDGAIGRIKGMLTLTPSKDGTVIRISVTTVEDAELAQLVANGLVEAYSQYKVDSKFKAIDSGIAHLEKQYKEQNSVVEKCRNDVYKIQKKYKLVSSPNIEIKNDNSAEITRLKGLLAEARVEYDSSKSLYDRVVQMPKDEFEEAIGVIITSDTKGYIELKNSLNQSEVDYELLLLDLGEMHPKVLRAKKTLDSLRRQMDSRMGGVKGGLAAQLKKIEIRIKSLEKEKAKLEAEYSGDVTLQISEFNTAVRHLHSQIKIEEALLEKINKERINLSLPRSRVVRVLQAARLPYKNYSIISVKHIAILIFLALASSLGIAFVLEYLNRKVSSVAEVESITDSQVLSVVPKFKIKKFAKIKSDESYCEMYRQLKTSLLFTMKNDDKVISVNSTMPQEGKTTTAAHLAFFMTEGYKKVLLIDLDLRHPSVHKLFNLKNDIGISQYLQGDVENIDELVTKTPNEHLDVIMPGEYQSGGYHLLIKENVTKIIESFKERYDYIIIDSPPLLPVSESSTISSCCDTGLLVVEAGRLSKGMLSQAMLKLKTAETRISGIVLNKINRVDHSYYYYQGYNHAKYYKYSYGKKNRFFNWKS